MRLYETHVTVGRPTQLSLLESAVYSPPNHNYYGQNGLFQLAGILAERIILNHAYQNGNKRIALLSADIFLKINGYHQVKKRPTGQDEVDEQLKNAHVAVAANTWTSEDLAECYRSIARPLGEGSYEGD